MTDKRDKALVESTLHAALTEEHLDFAPLLERARRRIARHSRDGLDFPTRVTVENKAHPTYSLVQIQTPDRLGLLYELLTAFGEENVSIALSRISTEKGAAIDTFYVADRDLRTKNHPIHRESRPCSKDCSRRRWGRRPNKAGKQIALAALRFQSSVALPIPLP